MGTCGGCAHAEELCQSQVPWPSVEQRSRETDQTGQRSDPIGSCLSHGRGKKGKRGQPSAALSRCAEKPSAICQKLPRPSRTSLRKPLTTFKSFRYIGLPWLRTPPLTPPFLILDLVACADAELCQKICGNPSGCSDIAYPKLVLELLPVGKEVGRSAGNDG